MLNFPFPKKTYIFGTADNDNLVGTYLDEIIYAYDGNDMLNGGGGKDWLYGGLGDDYYIISDTDDKVVEYADQGTDTVFSYITSYTLTDHVEKLQLVGTQALYGTGNGLDNRLTGNDQNNILSALDGNDVLDGRKGMDLMIGGYGDDNYYVDNSGDSIWEFADQGKDVVHTSATFVLSGHIENLYMQIGAGAIDATGNDLDNYIVGNDSNNILKGMDGKDTFSGNGGKDTMHGGAGDDYYILDSSDDLIVENMGEGYDTFYITTDYTMALNVERMLMDGSNAVTGKGNNQANAIEGSSADNFLFGYDGLDVLFGNKGNDTIDGGLANDLVYGGEDTDTLTGGGGNDKFQFRQAGGQEIITDFKANGDLDIMQVGVFNSFASVLAATQQVGNDTVITFDANTSMTLQNFNMNNLQAADFQFI